MGSFILGTDGPSQELEAALNSDEVQVVLASDEFVCLRLEAESEPHKQFAAICKQIYSSHQ